MSEKKYILVSPVKNEQTVMAKVIENVISQTILPYKWIIVNDNSTDQTEEIVKAYAERHAFIQLVSLNDEEARSYCSRTATVVYGCEQLNDVDFDYLGILDADIEIQNDYYELIIEKFNEDPQLGIAGGLVFDVCDDKVSNTRARSLDHVAGGVQMFRRACYKDIEGYRVLPYGGDDFVAETMARMHGWRVKSFPAIKVKHIRPTGSMERNNRLSFKFLEGIRDYSIGYHPLYHIMKCLRRIHEKPLLIAGLARQSGYMLASIRYQQKIISDEFIKFVRHEQMSKIKSKLSRLSVT